MHGQLDRLYDERARLWDLYRHTDDESVRRELRYRLDRLDWAEMDLRQQMIELQSQQLK